MKRAKTMLGALALMAAGFLFAAPAHAGFGTKVETHGGVTCRTWIGGSNTYPMDDEHYWVCWATPLSQRANSIANKVQSLGATGNIREFLKTQNVYYYYFIDRDDMNAYMSAKFPLEPMFQSSAARCGKTGYNNLNGRIITSIFDLCTYDHLSPPKQSSNLDLPKITSHESGHAFDWAWRKSKGGLPSVKGPSESDAFKTLGNFDMVRLDPADWVNKTKAQKINYVCNMFQQYLPSELERDLNTPNDKVCTNTTTVNPAYTTDGSTPKLPSDIAKQRVPYFVTTAGGQGSPLYQELFAELFSRQSQGGGTMLGMTDQVLWAANSPYKAFACTRWAIRMFWFTNEPPPLTGPDSLGQHDGCINNPGSWIP